MRCIYSMAAVCFNLYVCDLCDGCLLFGLWSALPSCRMFRCFDYDVLAILFVFSIRSYGVEYCVRMCCLVVDAVFLIFCRCGICLLCLAYGCITFLCL